MLWEVYRRNGEREKTFFAFIACKVNRKSKNPRDFPLDFLMDSLALKLDWRKAIIFERATLLCEVLPIHESVQLGWDSADGADVHRR